MEANHEANNSKIKVLTAFYVPENATEKKVDVVEDVRANCLTENHQVLVIPEDLNALFGDPSVGVPKTLQLKLEVKGVGTVEQTVPEKTGWVYPPCDDAQKRELLNNFWDSDIPTNKERIFRKKYFQKEYNVFWQTVGAVGATEYDVDPKDIPKLSEYFINRLNQPDNRGNQANHLRESLKLFESWVYCVTNVFGDIKYAIPSGGPEGGHWTLLLPHGLLLIKIFSTMGFIIVDIMPESQKDFWGCVEELGKKLVKGYEEHLEKSLKPKSNSIKESFKFGGTPSIMESKPQLTWKAT